MIPTGVNLVEGTTPEDRLEPTGGSSAKKKDPVGI
jgi:hypothetical protein